MKEQTRELWNKALGAMQIEGGTERQRTIFYTALYRSLGRMTDITEDGRYFSGYDHAVHDAKGTTSMWTTDCGIPIAPCIRCSYLLEAPQQEDMIRSYLRMYEQSGWLPSFPSVAGEQAVMIGHHAAAFILRCLREGLSRLRCRGSLRRRCGRMRPKRRCFPGAAVR